MILLSEIPLSFLILPQFLNSTTLHAGEQLRTLRYSRILQPPAYKNCVHFHHELSLKACNATSSIQDTVSQIGKINKPAAYFLDF